MSRLGKGMLGMLLVLLFFEIWLGRGSGEWEMCLGELEELVL